MRQLRLRLKNHGSTVSICAAALVPLGCGDTTHDPDPTAEGGAATTGGSATTGGAPATGGVPATGGAPTTGGVPATGGVPGLGGLTTTGGADPDEYPYAVGAPSSACPDEEPFVVPIPDEGVPPSLDFICPSAIPPPVPSRWAARLELESPAMARRATAKITLAPGLAVPATAPRVTVAAADPSVPLPTITVRQATAGGWEADLQWSDSNPMPSSGPDTRIVLAIELETECAPGRLVQVRAETVIMLCGEMLLPEWVASGDDCAVCSTICEMAPSPACADAAPDSIALAHPVRARLRELHRVGDDVVLLAEHDGGPGDWQYTWRVSAGELRWVERDVAIWRPPPGRVTSLAQVGIAGALGAAVASLPWDRAA